MHMFAQEEVIRECNVYARFTATVERQNRHLPDNLSQ